MVIKIQGFVIAKSVKFCYACLMAMPARSLSGALPVLSLGGFLVAANYSQ